MGQTFLGSMPANETLYYGAWILNGAAASPHAAFADFDSTTFMTHSAPSFTPPAALKIGFSSITIPSGAKVKYIQVFLRSRQVPATPAIVGRVDVATSTVDGTVPGEFSGMTDTIGHPDGIFFLSFAARPGGGEWTQADLDGITVSAISKSPFPPVLGIDGLQILVFVNYVPVVVASGPGVVTTTSYPDLLFSYSDADGDLQEMVEAKVFSGANAVANPTTETSRLVAHLEPTYSSATTISSIGLPNGAYRWAVRAKDVGGGGAESDWSAWSQVSFTMNAPAPNPPVLTAVPDPTNNRYTLTVSSGGGIATERFFLERSDDSGVTWVPVRDGEFANTGSPIVMYDYEAPRMARAGTAPVMLTQTYNAAIAYNTGIGYNETLGTAAVGPQNVVRFRATATRVLSGETIISAATVVNPTSLLGTATTWLKHPYSSAKSIVIQHLANWETASEEEIAALRASSRADHVVFGDVPSGEKGDLDIIFPGDAAWEAFELLRSPGGDVAASPLLLQTCFGDTVLEQLWVRLGPTRSITRVTHRGQNTLQYRRCKVGFFETIRPLVD